MYSDNHVNTLVECTGQYNAYVHLSLSHTLARTHTRTPPPTHTHTHTHSGGRGDVPMVILAESTYLPSIYATAPPRSNPLFQSGARQHDKLTVDFPPKWPPSQTHCFRQGGRQCDIHSVVFPKSAPQTQPTVSGKG